MLSRYHLTFFGSFQTPPKAFVQIIPPGQSKTHTGQLHSKLKNRLKYRITLNLI